MILLVTVGIVSFAVGVLSGWVLLLAFCRS